eukprot:Partr_v1_DN27429_c0_g1_i3_m72191 putative coiled-coil domain containing 65
MNKYRTENEDLSRMLKKISADLQELTTSESHEWKGQREDERNRIIEEKQTMRIQMESIIEDLWRQFQESLDHYNENTRERRTQYETLRRKDADNSAVIDEQITKLLRVQETIAQLRSQLSANNNDSTTQIKSLRKRKELIATHFHHIKRMMTVTRGDEKKKLTKLAVNGKTVLNKMEKKSQMAADLLRTAEMCLKYETNEDRLSALSVDTPTNADLTAGLLLKHTHVSMDNIQLEREKKRALQENEELKQQLKLIIDGMQVTDKIMHQDNSLMMINGKSNIVKLGGKELGIGGVLDGNDFMRGVQRMQKP